MEEVQAAGSSAIAGDEQERAPVATTPPSGASAPQRKKWTPEQKRVALAFMRAAIEDLMVYMARTEEDVEEQYHRAGKLHKYEPEKEMDKRFARLIKVHNPPEGFVPNIDYYLSLSLAE
jgi:hypothetical protein